MSDVNIGSTFDMSASFQLGPREIGGSGFFWRIKRLFDIVASLFLLPILALVALGLLVANPFLNKGSLIFVQDRMGLHCRPFKVVKFRTMQHAEVHSRGAADTIEKDRITPLGEVLRKMRIDELPQILNVLKGEMSLIGPRPDIYDHALEFVDAVPGYRQRHDVLPGISGFAQVTLGYAVGLEATKAKAMADMAYIQHASFALDARIFWLTLVTVFMRRGA